MRRICYTEPMIEKVFKKLKLGDDTAAADLEYWLSRPPEERVAAVEILRKQQYGNAGRIQRVVRIVKRSTGRLRDLADLEALGEP
ncbi:MAG: hypothetical protein HYV27_08705 [Candidatus Hydrogenedentes bacterium]|nr:hypothetical protein [Candidatus Hydrogenedentota bacterium]